MSRIIEDGWELTRRVSPQPRVRVAQVDAYGTVLNNYAGRGAAVSGPVPPRPWAMNLAGTDRRFRFLAFDLDAKGSLAQVDDDTRTIRALLDDAEIAHLVCQSGPTGGRHVWVALADSADEDTVRSLAKDVKAFCPSLDLSPMSNPATGSVRPPGAPHRDGGYSTVILGSTETLVTPSTTAAQLRQLALAASVLAAAAEPDAVLDPARPLPVDTHGRLYLPGLRRPLPPGSAAALEEDAASGDASSVLWRVLIGAAAARWRYTDVAALLPSSAGLEHVRTLRQGAARAARPSRGPESSARVLARQWDKAVRHAAVTPRAGGGDPTFDARAGVIADHVRTLQQRADAAPGRWRRGGGPTDRRILDALSMLALRAVQPAVEADIRRLAVLCGISRETARTALLRLAVDGWITRTEGAEGARASRWTIDPQNVLHRDADLTRSQADPRPVGAGSADRRHLDDDISSRLRTSAHDLFTAGPGLGHHLGNLYAKAVATPLELDGEGVASLARQGLLVQPGASGRTAPERHLHRLAVERGVDGTLAARSRRYQLERELWAWWQAEQEWMSTAKRTRPGRRPSPEQIYLYADGTNRHGRHPRRSDGRADYQLARALLEEALTRRLPAFTTDQAGRQARVAA